MRLLIIEDNIDFQKFLKTRLEEKCFAVDATSDGEHGLYLATIHPYDIILLDYSLPNKNGYEICSELRARGKQTPIIMISGTGDILHKVDGLNIGIDDYIVKPFFFEELLARINAILRRSPVSHNTILTFDNLSLDTFALLEYLLKNAATVVTRGAIMEHVWDTKLDLFSNTIETHILNLRKKIDLTRHKKLIHNIPGRGYKLDSKK